MVTPKLWSSRPSDASRYPRPAGAAGWKWGLGRRGLGGSVQGSAPPGGIRQSSGPAGRGTGFSGSYSEESLPRQGAERAREAAVSRPQGARRGAPSPRAPPRAPPLPPRPPLPRPHPGLACGPRRAGRGGEGGGSTAARGALWAALASAGDHLLAVNASPARLGRRRGNAGRG